MQNNEFREISLSFYVQLLEIVHNEILQKEILHVLVPRYYCALFRV